MKSKILFFIFCFLFYSFLLSAEVIWDNFYNPFGATGLYVSPHMVICTDGGYAITGHYVIEDPCGSYIEYYGFVMKMSPEGELLWAEKDTLSFMGWNSSKAIIETSDGGLINGSGYLIKRDSNGNRLWSQNLDYLITTMCYSHNGNIVLSGGITGGDCLFRIIDEDGNEILNNDFSLGLYSTTSKRIIPTSDGGYALTGRITDEIPDSDIFICKTDAVGDTIWTYRKNGSGSSDVGNWIIENSDNKLLIVGGIHPEPLTIRGYIALFDLDGNNILEEIVGDENIWYEHFYAIDNPYNESFMMSTMYRFYKCNYEYTNIEWICEDPSGYFQLLSEGFIFYIGGIDGVHLVKTDHNLVSIEENVIPPNQNYLECYPNPFNPEITISFNIGNATTNSHINIYNSKGQRVKQYNVIQKNDTIVWSGIDESGTKISSGVYFVTLNSNNKTLAFKKITMIK